MYFIEFFLEQVVVRKNTCWSEFNLSLI